MFDLLTVMMELNISVLFGLGKYDVIYDNIKYPIRLKNAITYVFFSYNCARIKIDSHDENDSHIDQNCNNWNSFLIV